MTKRLILVAGFMLLATNSIAKSEDRFKVELCDAAKNNKVVELVYKDDKSKGCLPRIVDVHQVAVGNNGKLYMHGYQHRGCTKSRDYASERIFRFDQMKSVTIVDGSFPAKSQSIKAEGWDGCIGNNCFIKENICE